MKYDDGRDARGILKADIVLIGISRTSKTPLSQYLAHNKRLKVANVPLVPEVDPPEELYQVAKEKMLRFENYAREVKSYSKRAIEITWTK